MTAFPRSTCLVYFYLVLVLTSDLLVPVYTFSQTWTPNDVISMQELVDDNARLVFEGHKQETDFFKILLLDGDFAIIGGRNKAHNISLQTLSEDEDRLLKWEPKKHDIRKCEEKKQSKCQNYIRVMGWIDGKLYVCGTNAFKPTCRKYEYKEENLPAQVAEYVSVHEESGIGMCPYDPERNSTVVFTDNTLYSATSTDSLAREPLIIESKTRITTEMANSNIFSDPNFVSSFDLEEDDFVYFFYRENAVENINCGKATFSRVARICKQDLGSLMMDQTFTSFFKSRLNCSIPGANPFQFDELQGTSDFQLGNYMPTGLPENRTKMIYGVFNTPDNSIHGSAICAFTRSDILNSFHGKFKGQESSSHNWLPVPESKAPVPHPAKSCVNNSKTLSYDTVEFIRNHPLMDGAVNPAGGAPVLTQTNSKGGRFTSIAVDWQHFAADKKYYDILFVGTTDGRVLKSLNKGVDGLVESVVIEDMQVLGVNEPIQELKIYRKGNIEKLIVISRQNVVSIPLHRCHRFKTCGDCVAQQDPYCTWKTGLCVNVPQGLIDIVNGDVSVCPDHGIRAQTESKVATTTTEAPKVTDKPCPVCECNCSQAEPDAAAHTKTFIEDYQPDIPYLEPETERNAPQDNPCEARGSTGGDIYTASTLAIACVVSVVVAVLIGFVIGYRVSMCRNHTRNTEQLMPNYEQHWGSLRKGSNRHSMEANIYNSPKQFKQNNVLVSNNITQKNPNLPNGSIESKTVTPKQAKTYL